MLKLLDLKKDIVFEVSPAGTGKTLIAVQVAIKLFQGKVVDKIIVTRPVVSVEARWILPGILEEKKARNRFLISWDTLYKINFFFLIEDIVNITISIYAGGTFKRAFILAGDAKYNC